MRLDWGDFKEIFFCSIDKNIMENFEIFLKHI